MLAKEATEPELRELEQLLRSNPGLHYPLQTIASLWQTSGPEDQKKAEEAFARHLDRMSALSIHVETPGNDTGTDDPVTGFRLRRSRRLLAAASVTIALTVTGFFFYRSSPQKGPVASAPAAQAGEVATRNGSRTSLYLPDGTHVWLNAGSRITYNKNFGAAMREVNLSGEAFFDVAHDPASPFIIHTSRIDIRVLGTSFNVKSYPADKTTETVLIRGSIEVALHNKANEKIILKPDEKLVVGNDENNALRRHPVTVAAAQQEEPFVAVQKPTYERSTGAILETSWVRGQLEFQDEPFSELALKFERWYGVSIRFADAGVQTLRFTGTFRDETITEALEALKLTAHFDYTINDNQITIAK